MAGRSLNRLLAWLIDWACILVWVAVTAAVGIPLYLSGVTRGLSSGTLILVSTIILVLPVTVVFACFESGARQATPGKRLRKLTVVAALGGSRISFVRALLRNTLKIALPWTVGHAAVFALVEVTGSGMVPVWVWLCTGFSYVLPISYVIFLFVGRGRTPYDFLSGTAVV